jgi:ribosomal protein S14
MSKLPTDVRLAYEPTTTPGTLYYECRRCGRKTKTYRKMTRHLHRCPKNGRRGALPLRG